MNSVIHRVVGKVAHLLNVSTGEIMSFNLNSDEADHLVKNWEKIGDELNEDVRNLFSSHGQPNTRLCRDKLNCLGLEHGFPTIAHLEINRRCSLICKHCYINKNELKSTVQSVFEEIPENEIHSLFDDLSVMGIFLLVFTGGEPFLNKRLRLFLQLAMEKGFVSEIFTNLQHLPAWFINTNINDVNVGRIQVSVYSSDPQIHDKITRTKGSFRNTLENINFLKSRGYYIEVATPLMSDNFSSWENTRKFFASLGIPQNFSWPIVDEYYGEKTGKTSLNISEGEFGEFIVSNPDFLIETCFSSNPNEVICEAGTSLFSIAATGDVFPCSQFPYRIGNIKKHRIQTIYNSSRMQQIRNLRNIDTGLEVAYNYCIGGNYSETGNPLEQPLFFTRSIDEALRRREQMKYTPVQRTKVSPCTRCSTRSSSH